MKRWLINGFGIALALCLALGGLLLMEHLLKKMQMRDLMASGGLDKTGLSLDNTKQNGERSKLTKDELKQVLSAMKGKEIPHEPLEGQLSMEQAIELGKKWLEEYCLNGLEMNTMEEQNYQRIDARLCTRQKEDTMENFNIRYSYWTVSFTSQEIRAELVMNAVSGQVLDARLTLNRANKKQDERSVTYAVTISNEAIFQLLERYIASFGLKAGNLILIGQGEFSQSAEEGEFYAWARTGNVMSHVQTEEFQVGEYEEEECLYLSLTTTEP